MATLEEVKTQLSDLQTLAGDINTQFDVVVTKIDALQEQVASGSVVTAADLDDLNASAQAVKDTLAQVDAKQDAEIADGA